jgi:hypothetical protein
MLVPKCYKKGLGVMNIVGIGGGSLRCCVDWGLREAYPPMFLMARDKMKGRDPWNVKTRRRGSVLPEFFGLWWEALWRASRVLS